LKLLQNYTLDAELWQGLKFTIITKNYVIGTNEYRQHFELDLIEEIVIFVGITKSLKLALATYAYPIK
jgi:hypothetical protein